MRIKDNISLIDYGCGNLKSLINFIIKFEIYPKIVNSPDQVDQDDILIMPGVGSFDFALKNLHQKKLYDVIKTHIKNNGKLLGICLGMQLLCTSSKESESSQKGFNVFKGDAEPLGNYLCNTGWLRNHRADRYSPIDFEEKYFYFNHRYFCNLDNNVIGFVEIGDRKIPSVAKSKNIIGLQFHPEKSQKNGFELFGQILEIYSQ